ncbi:MAG: nitroreductase [Actinobacteria bacterium]|nr:nitroreductase [Actinomycetota bacterium]
MEFKKPVIDLIKTRNSIRSYESCYLKTEEIKKIVDFLKKDHKTVFGSKLRFKFIDASDMYPENLRNLGTYGMIKGARYFIGGVFEKKENNKNCLVDFGYVFEKIILFITDLGFGTCWLGGTFNKKGFAQKITVNSNEIVPAVSPVGISQKKRDLRSSVIRMLAGAKNRKPWGKLFFSGSFGTGLSETDAMPYQTPLEMVRVGPSASNLQPWRIIKENNSNIFHFFVKKSWHLDAGQNHLNLQYIDMGIALCHFELTALELGLKGKWALHDNIPESEKYSLSPDMDYIITWDGLSISSAD